MDRDGARIPPLLDPLLIITISYFINSCHCCYFVDFTAGFVDWRVLRVVERVCSQLYVAIGSALLCWVYDDQLLSHVSSITCYVALLWVYVDKRLSLVGYVTLYNFTYCVLRVHSHLRRVKCELLHELFSPRNREKWVHNPSLNSSAHAKANQTANANAPTQYSTPHHLAKVYVIVHI